MITNFEDGVWSEQDPEPENVEPKLNESSEIVEFNFADEAKAETDPAEIEILAIEHLPEGMCFH